MKLVRFVLIISTLYLSISIVNSHHDVQTTASDNNLKTIKRNGGNYSRGDSRKGSSDYSTHDSRGGYSGYRNGGSRGGNTGFNSSKSTEYIGSSRGFSGKGSRNPSVGNKFQSEQVSTGPSASSNAYTSGTSRFNSNNNKNPNINSYSYQNSNKRNSAKSTNKRRKRNQEKGKKHLKKSKGNKSKIF